MPPVPTEDQSSANELPPSNPPAAAPSDDGLLPMEDPLVGGSAAAQQEAEALSPEEQAARLAAGETATIEPRPPALNVVQEFETFQPLEGPWSEDDVVLPLAADTIERTQEILAAQPNISVTETEQGREWAYYFNHGQRSQARADYFQSTVTREGSEFRQVVKSEKGLLGASAPKLGENTDGFKATGEAAVLRVRALMGLGTIVQIPLWHSGFWVTLKAPSDSQFLELHRRLTEEKINLGRQTYGLAYANNSVFFAGAVMDFAMNHIYDTTLKDKEKIREMISTLDIPLIAWGLACTIWPKGFQYVRSIPDQSKGPTRTIKEKLNLSKLLFVDTKSLSPWQITHMAQRHGNTMTAESVRRYRDEFVRGRGREVELAANLKVVLKVPSMDEYLNNGQRWVNEIVAMVDKAFGMPRDGESRDEYILNQGKATNFRQYAHWVERVIAGGMEVDNGETMDQIFDALSASDAIRDKFFEEVRRFMEDATVGVIAVPTFEENERDKPLPRHPHLLPLDALSTFFTLLVQRAERVMSRD